MSRFLAASAVATVVFTAAATSGCSAREQDASADVNVGVCALERPDSLGQQFQWAYCAITVNNQSGAMRAYTINLTCTSAERTTPFAAGLELYYVPAGQHTISSDGILTSDTDQNMTCQTRSATVRSPTPEDGNPPEAAPSPSGALADALTTAGPEATPTPQDTAAEAAASAEASPSAAASASAGTALATLQHRALARIYTLGDYTVKLTNAEPPAIDATVTSHSSDTDTMKQFGVVVTLLRANGSLDTSGTLCVELTGGTYQDVYTTTDGGTPDWTSIRITRSPTTPC